MGILDGLGKAVGGDSGIGKITDVVDDLWDKRSDIIHAIGWVKDHGDDLVRFMQQLPELLAKVGDSMDFAGKAAHTASGFLGGTSQTADDGGSTVSHLAQLAGDSLGRAQSQIGSVARVLSELGDNFGHVPIVGNALMGKTAEGAGLLGGFSDEMAEIAQQLGHLAERIGTVSGHLSQVGNGLVDSSGMLKGFTN